MSINEAKWTLFFVSLCFQNNLLFGLDFSQLPCWNCLELFPFLVHGSLCIWNIHRLWHRDELMHQIIMCHRSESFLGNAIFMGFGLQRFCSLSRRLVRFHHTTIHTPFHLHFLHCVVFTMLDCSFSRLQGMAGATGLSSFS